MPETSRTIGESGETLPEQGSLGGDSLEQTEVDSYATAAPSPAPANLLASEAIPSTLEDPFETRMAEPVSIGTRVEPTEFRAGEFGGFAPMGGSGPSRYRAVKLHAKGGLGEVFLAIDSELNREVALKEIQERHLHNMDCQLRFLFEAEITGGLEHPGIVPVYGLGRHPDGRPYYAMRFIRGDSLKTAIRRFHEPDEGEGRAGETASDLAHSLEFRQLVSRFVAACHAIDYAHGRGVIHRDIKPDNIMIGAHGETLVVDWGLAKALDRPEPVEPSALKLLRPISGNNTSATLAGSIMGTPAFMSPEQAAGEVESLGPGSDIFSLGSTLYAMMTGHPPFLEKGLLDLLEKVKNGEFPPPRALNRKIPPALEAIALKAMALRPSDRYSTAAALADDLERWLADEPVLAYPEPWTARFARKARRHRTAVAGVFVLLLTASTALAIGNVLIHREKLRAEREHHRARAAVEEMLTLVGEVDLADVPQMEAVRRDLLGRALAFYRETLVERRDDSTSRLETGLALARMGDILELLGQYPEAEKDYREALALLDAPDLPAGLAERRASGRAKTNLGVLLKRSNRFVEAEAATRLALTELQKLASANPDDTETARAASAALYQLATVIARLDRRTDEEQAAYLRAIQEQRELANKSPNRPEDRLAAARYLNNLGILESRSDPNGAETTFLEASKILDEIQGTLGTNAGFRWQRARTWNNLANLYTRARMAEEAASMFSKARAAFDGLVADFPRVPSYRRELAMMLNNQAQFLASQPPGVAKPLDLLLRAEAEQEWLVREFSEVPDHRMKLAITLLHLGDLLRSTDTSASEAALAKAAQLQEKLVAEYPNVPEYRAAIGRTLTEQARSEAVLGRQAEALELLKPAIAAIERAIDGNPRDQTYVRFLFDARDDRCRVLLQLGQHAELALEAARLQRIAPDRPEAPLAAAGFLARCFEMAGSDATLDESRRRSLQEIYAQDAMNALREALERGKPDPATLDGPDFKPLQGRPDFQKLREDWNARGRQGIG